MLIAGTGFAGQGHTDAFRAAHTDVVGMVGRTASVASAVSSKLGIPYCGTQWQEALLSCKPDIVSIGTPGGAHYIQAKQAIEFGCHVFCEKPLTDNANSAGELFRLAQSAGIKTAYAASFRYTPSVLHAKQLIEEGAIGEPTEVECISHFKLERGIPFGWSHRKADGGGRLNNHFTHALSVVTSILGDNIVSIMGDVRDDLGKAPVVSGVHDFTKRRQFIPRDLNDKSLEWKNSDVEWSYTVLARVQSNLAKNPVSVMFKHGGLVPRFNDDHIVFYGREGALYLKGHYGSGQLYMHRNKDIWLELPIPRQISMAVPKVQGETEQCWHYLVNEFVKDIRGEPVKPYPTFYEGHRYQQIIELIRETDSWTVVPVTQNH